MQVKIKTSNEAVFSIDCENSTLVLDLKKKIAEHYNGNRLFKNLEIGALRTWESGLESYLNLAPFKARLAIQSTARSSCYSIHVPSKGAIHYPQTNSISTKILMIQFYRRNGCS